MLTKAPGGSVCSREDMQYFDSYSSFETWSKFLNSEQILLQFQQISLFNSVNIRIKIKNLKYSRV